MICRFNMIQMEGCLGQGDSVLERFCLSGSVQTSRDVWWLHANPSERCQCLPPGQWLFGRGRLHSFCWCGECGPLSLSTQCDLRFLPVSYAARFFFPIDSASYSFFWGREVRVFRSPSPSWCLCRMISGSFPWLRVNNLDLPHSVVSCWHYYVICVIYL